MRKGILSGLFIFIVASSAFAQKKESSSIIKYLDLAATVGNQQGSFAASYIYDWRLGKKQRWEAGVGLRLTSVFGTKLDYTTAGPARITRGTNIPFAVVASAQKTENWDTLNVQRPFTNSLNLSANIAYHFTKKWSGGCNIDVIGATFGRKTSGVYTSDGTTKIDPAVKPTTFNLLLTGDNDLGSLNSEFFVKYDFQKHWGIRGVYQFLFTEYKTTNLHQTITDGTEISRFRNKANNFGFAITYSF